MKKYKISEPCHPELVSGSDTVKTCHTRKDIRSRPHWDILHASPLVQRQKQSNKFGMTLTVALLSFFIGTAHAASISGEILNSGINRGAVAISVKDIASGKTVYKLNDTRPMPPASTLKLLTFSAAFDKLGKDYEFTTALYKTKNNDLLLKLGADPYFTSGELGEMIKAAKVQKIISPNNFYIDDSIIDKKEWGEGWQWDDELNPLMSKISAYNIDKNLLPVVITPTTNGAPAQIHTAKFYPVTFSNLVTTTKDVSKVELCRNNAISPDIITIEGHVSSQVTKNIPVNNPKRYFTLRLEELIRKEKIDYYKPFNHQPPTTNHQPIKEIKHPILLAAEDVLKNSNNLVAESVFKIAGGGTQEGAAKMFQAYADKIGLDTCGIRIVDGSGVSKNNLVTADFMTSFLVLRAKQPDFEEFKNMLAKANEGTLADRMLYFNDKIHAKTGTLSDVSAIAGYITAKSGKVYAFDIMINDPKPYDKKSLEEHILRVIHSNF
jgi:D-alanyl-D-alanine carboxypeptidase/D-alanyl-D-alanine-endopeptidase (penicillin-binding protein 4)